MNAKTDLTKKLKIYKTKIPSHATGNYENKCTLHGISRRIGWEGPLGGQNK